MQAKYVIIGMLAVTAVGAAGLYYSAEYAYYEEVRADSPEGTVRLTSLATGAPEAVPTDGFEGIDADSSPLRFRACFTLPTSIATLTETYKVYDDPVPLVAPNHFSCFDARKIGRALEAGEAFAFLGQANITYGVDRVIAVYPDGRAYAWNQMNICGETVFDGKPAPEGCPPMPETY